MRLINENVEREAEGVDIQKWKNKGYTELETEEIPPDSAEDNSEIRRFSFRGRNARSKTELRRAYRTGIERTCKVERLRRDKFLK